jgi:ribosomal protein L7/L12
MTGKFEPPIFRKIEILYEKERKPIAPLYPADKKTGEIELPDAVIAELKYFLLVGNKPAAVKKVADLTGAGLRASKDYVDGLSR